VPGDTSQQESSQQDSADRRTRLAADRTVFAAERTYAAWVRTGLAALASGVGARKLLEGVVADWMIWGVGTILVLFSAFSFGAAVWRQVFSGAPPPHPDTPRIPPALLSSTLRKSGGVLFPCGNAQAGKHAASSKRLASGAGIFTMSRLWPEA
jgi:putative membrane protein